ncbi:hypothetical protein [Halomonas sp. KO116]|uniref:hypothetical protein n=1 Tax=Halomonas sp. KO116 TaxID=1504981 RepID=UPI0004E2C154|nr:hypothetical protein [Halomonas sp. KO116]AJY50644.1 hypothetical protein KO116_02167 [Halomonas sp. KO116]
MFGIRKQSKVEAEWQAWLIRRKSLKVAIDELAITEARSSHTVAENKARHAAMDAKAHMGFRRDLQHLPTDKERQSITAALSKHVADLMDKGRTDLAFQPKQELAELKEANKAAEATLQRLESLEGQKDALEIELQSLVSNPPHADLKALEMLEKEQARLNSEKARVREALDSMTDDNGAIKQAVREARAAQKQLDDIEASAALGDSTDSEQRSAAAALAKAKARATKAKEEADKRSSARRGLESKLCKVEEQAEELSLLHNEVALNVYEEQTKESEKRLIDFLEAEEMQSITKQLYEARNGYEKAVAQRQGRRPRTGEQVAVMLPGIKFHHYNTAGNVHGVDVTLKI